MENWQKGVCAQLQSAGKSLPFSIGTFKQLKLKCCYCQRQSQEPNTTQSASAAELMGSLLLFLFSATLTAMTALPVLGVLNNDKRDTPSFIFHIGLPALEECTKNNKRVIAITAKPGSATLQQQELKSSWNSCLCSFSPTLQQLPWRKCSIIPGSTHVHHCSHLIGLSRRQG